MAILEVAIGVVFFFVTLSLLTSTVAEWWSRRKDKRGALLEDGIRLLLGGKRQQTRADGQLLDEPGKVSLRTKLEGGLRRLTRRGPLPATPNEGAASNDFLESVLAHPLIRTRGTGEFPKAIEPQDFARAVLAVAGGDKAVQATTNLSALVAKIEEPRIRQALMALLSGSNTTIEDFQARIATWFEAAMGETTRLYRRAMDLVVRWFAVLIVVVLNADALVLIEVLWKDPALRATLVAAAEDLDPNAPSDTELEGIIASARKDLEPFPLGWPSCEAWDSDPRGFPEGRLWIFSLLMKLAGFGMTILAVSLGAPFWFDLLRKFLDLRRGSSSASVQVESGSGASPKAVAVIAEAPNN